MREEELSASIQFSKQKLIKSILFEIIINNIWVVLRELKCYFLG